MNRSAKQAPRRPHHHAWAARPLCSFCRICAAQVKQALDIARELGLPALLMGNGSSLIVRDGGVRALVICLGGRFARVDIDGEVLTAQARATLARVASMAQEAQGLPGWSSPAASPARSGGGVAMNAGAYGGQLSDVSRRACCWVASHPQPRRPWRWGTA